MKEIGVVSDQFVGTDLCLEGKFPINWGREDISAANAVLNSINSDFDFFPELMKPQFLLLKNYVFVGFYCFI